MKRSAVTLEDVSALPNLTRAYWLAARSSHQRSEVERFSRDLDRELDQLSRDIRSQSVEVGQFQTFRIFDPKPRTIHAPSFRERVLHHALMAVVGPPLDRALVADTFACRLDKGALRAVERAQHHARRHPWFVKIDVRAYFDSIDHAILLRLIERRFKNPYLLGLCSRIVCAYETTPGKGLPIGALYSQHFANYYLAALDRYLLEELRVAGMVRYMDDVVWWCAGRGCAKQTLRAAREFAGRALRLELKPGVQIGRSDRGLNLCGFRVLPGALRLSKRRKARYASARRRWEARYRLGLIDAIELQKGYASAFAITAHADALAFRREQLRRAPALEC